MRSIRFVAVGFVAVASGTFAEPRQVPDPDFDTQVTQPALLRDRPKLLFDEAHYNIHRADTTYRAFAEVVRNDGASLVVNHARFKPATLRGYRVLVIAGPLGGPVENEKQARSPAFTAGEIDAVRRWVRRGGGLLLLTDHEPVASASADMVAAFGIVPSRTVILDRTHRLENMYPANILATADNGLLRPNPITCEVRRVIVFGGQSLTSPPNAVGIAMGSSARREDGGQPEGNAQLSAFAYGRGRVVVTADMGMLSAQLIVDGDQKNPWGMNWPGIDNRQLLLNAVRWLSGHKPCLGS